MKPKSHSKSNKQKEMRIAKTISAKEAIGILKKNTDLFILTYGQFSLIDALMAILDQIGPAHVVISTWTAANAHLEKTASLIESSDFLSFKMIVDRSFKTRQPKYFRHMISLFGSGCIRQMTTHAKFITIKNDDWDIVIRTSMNLNENPRLENIEISDSKNMMIFFDQIVKGIFSEVKENESRWKPVSLPGMEEEIPYKKIKAKSIKRRSLNEIETTHTI